jgi:hypothetical protein
MAKTIVELLADAELGPVITAHIDRCVTQAIKTFSDRHPPAGEAEAALAARIERIEKAHVASVAAANLQFFTYKRATELGIDYGLVEDLSFPDAKAAEVKLKALAGAISKKKIEDINRDMIENSHKPGSGNSGGRSQDAFSVLRPDELEVAKSLRPDGSQRGRS